MEFNDGRKSWDRNRGIQHNNFSEALKRANSDIVPEEEHEGGVRRNSGTDIADPYGSFFKPQNIPAWDHPPITPAEEALYFGVHIHSESNPHGLHTHITGGKTGGGHSHGPQNRFGSHTHKSDIPLYGLQLDGSHVHDGENCPAGPHTHCPENFG